MSNRSRRQTSSCPVKGAANVTTLAYYLPQFHEIPENNRWWGDGFTEWTQLRSAKQFIANQQIRKPIPPLGYYNLIEPKTLELQHEIAAAHGLDGFAIWDYWFGNGKRLLEKPSEIALSKKLKFRYCFAWANHSWMDKSRDVLLCKQEYLGKRDYEAYFMKCLPHFESTNYIRIDGKPVFIIYAPHDLPSLSEFQDTWRELAEKQGYQGIFFIGDRLYKSDPLIDCFDKYCNSFGYMTRRKKLFLNYFKEELNSRFGVQLGGPRVFNYSKVVQHSIPAYVKPSYAPTALAGWDTTPRHGKRGVIFEGFNISSFATHLAEIAMFVRNNKAEHNVVLLKSWNEWAEGNTLEPDDIFGFELLTVFKDAVASMRDVRTV